jgi:cobalamin biosynthetic protein CobC
MKHGGDLAEAIKRYGVPDDDWLDLSTGINAESYPFRPPRQESWSALPQMAALKGLLAAARRSYGAPDDAPILAAPGTQILIQLLPLVRPAKRVAIVGQTYSEHSACWQQHGARVIFTERLECPDGAEILVVVNPNNPTGRIWAPDRLQTCREEMAARGGLLIVDEAFADIAPEVSLSTQAGAEGLIILRSFGKFFGLAGIRLGFSLGQADILSKLDSLLGPWAVSGIALDIGCQALDDFGWQQGARTRCYQVSANLDDLLGGAGFQIIGGTALFRLVSHPEAHAIHDYLANRGIWVRSFDHPRDWLRFGLPGDDAAFKRLSTALDECPY